MTKNNKTETTPKDDKFKRKKEDEAMESLEKSKIGPFINVFVSTNREW